MRLIPRSPSPKKLEPQQALERQGNPPPRSGLAVRAIPSVSFAIAPASDR
ncbi:MAG: hypothetical protein VKJ46_12190 [Leptolyngbyaceae bacterium]|nr:hypothetical protein [Leptolyngbyaceae bacterium]